MWVRKHNTSAVFGLVFVLAALTACDDDPTEPNGITSEDLPGTYEVVAWTVTDEDGNETDMLDEGAELTITLGDDGTTDGDLLVPGGDGDGEDLEVPLDGTFSFDEDAALLEIDHEEDAFVEEVDFTALRANGTIRLEGEGTIDGETVEIVLEKQ